MQPCTMTFHRDIEFLLTHVDDDPLLLFARGVDWKGFRERWERIWHGDRSNDPAGRKLGDAVLVRKLLALGSLPHASYAQMQKNVLADHPWRRFLELTGIELPPDKNTLGVDADRLVGSGAMATLFADFLAQMAAAGDTPEAGQRIDSTWVRVPKPHNTRAENKALKNGQLPPGWDTQPHQLR